MNHPSRLLLASAFCSLLLPLAAHSATITSPAGFTLSPTVIDYRNSPVGILAGGSSINLQYASIGVLHDRSTTTPPGPTGISSDSGLPGLESNANDPDPFLPITIRFTVPVSQVGADFLMGSPTDSITLTAFRADNTVIESATIAPLAMPLRPGPFGFNEGFIGLITTENIASVRFTPGVSAPFVIDDLQFAGVPEPATFGFGLMLLGVCANSRLRSSRRG